MLSPETLLGHQPGKQFRLDLFEELMGDNFAGGGGYSTGIEMATGRHVDHAINHSFDALGMHRINHPLTIHHQEDVFEVNPRKIAEGRRFGYVHFSPDCKHFSKAKGGKPLSKKIRGLAFVMLRWAQANVRVMSMENVEEIKTWGPLLHHPKHGAECHCGAPCGKADPAHKGRTWQAFLAALGGGVAADHPDLPEMLEVLGGSVTREELVRGFGYHCEVRELRACDYGAPTIRKRLFMLARCDGKPIVWPTATHAEPATAKKLGLKPWRAVAECIDWSLPCHSIFLTPAQARVVKCRRPLRSSTLRRIATGVDRYVLKAKKPFLVSLTHQGSDNRVESIDEPAKTLTGANRGEKALVKCEVGSGKDEAAFINRATHSDQSPNGVKRWGKGHHPVTESLGTQPASNEFALVKTDLAPFITEHANASNQRNMPADEPLRSICAEVKGGHFAPVAATLMKYHGDHAGRKDGAARGQSMDEPITVQDTSNRFGVVAASLTKFNTGAVGSELSQPLPVITAGTHSPETHGGAASVHGLVEASLVPMNPDAQSGVLVGAGGPVYCGKPKPLDTPSNTLLTESHINLAATSLVKLRGDNIGSPADEPAHTISAGGTHHGVAAAYLAQHNGGFNTTPGHAAEEPISTISGTGSQQQVVASNLVKYYGTDQDPRMEEPCHSVTTRDRFGLIESKAVEHLPVVSPSGLTPEQLAGALRVAAFLREYGVQFEGEFATVGGYVIVDIGMRMLTPRELFRAQGFPEEYVIDRAWVVDPKNGGITEIRLTKEQQIRMCGNSVCPPVAAAIVRANVPELCLVSPRS